ncbi:virion morphogenesis protein [Pseudoalteromonas ruthenica]|uniref:virion morphogenesis protein n=1 Tax=Pseudoalteromonas ruthenica TaxID=151081 RepID=UPI00034A213B|nr:virion morphogenesis protein [Pseudoalteromonas ruthenica]
MLTSRISHDNRDQLALLKLDDRTRRRVFRSAGRKVRRDSKARLKGQKDLENKRWPVRADGTKKRMLRRIGRKMIVKTSPAGARVQFDSPRTARIASAHQHGAEQERTAGEQQRIYGTPDYDAPASRKLAKKLIAAGYKIRRAKGKGYKRPSVKWITENLSTAKAGFILKLLSDEPSKERWTLKTPKRSFLGQSRDELKELKNFMLDEAMRLR